MNFPHIHHIDDVLPALAGRTEFSIKRGAGYTSIDYNFVLPDTFDCPIRRECRGIKFDGEGRILARPFHKFFNLGEKPETQALDLSQPHIVTEKLDGSLVHTAVVANQLVFMTRAGVTDISEAACRIASPALIEWCWECMDLDLTPIFEYTAPDNRIVIAYDKPELRLLTVRDSITGEYTVPEGRTFARAQVLVGTSLEDVKTWTDREGVVLHFPETGLHVKVKADDYVLRHKARDALELEKNAVELVLRGSVDDILPLLPPAEARALETYHGDLLLALSRLASMAVVAVERGRGMERKQFATEVVPALPPLLQPVAFAVRDGKHPLVALKTVALKHVSSGTKVSAFLEENHLPRWAWYWQWRGE